LGSLVLFKNEINKLPGRYGPNGNINLLKIYRYWRGLELGSGEHLELCIGGLLYR